MSRVYASALFVGLLGCPGKDSAPTTDSDTPTTDTDTETSPTPTDSGDSADSGDSGTGTGGERTIITAASATCDKADVLTLFAQANGWTGGGIVFMQETGNTEPQYNEAHTIQSYDAAASGKLDKLKATLATGATAPYIPGTNTVFTCDGHIEAKDKSGAPSVMTYIVLIVDETNKPTDCMAFGHDPMGLLSGVHTGVNEPPAIFRDVLDLCVVGTNVTP